MQLYPENTPDVVWPRSWLVSIQVVNVHRLCLGLQQGCVLGSSSDKIHTTSILLECWIVQQSRTNASRVGREVGCDEKIKQLGNWQNKVSNCAKRFSLKLTGLRYCVGHLAIILDKDKERLFIEVRSHTIFYDASHRFYKENIKNMTGKAISEAMGVNS